MSDLDDLRALAGIGKNGLDSPSPVGTYTAKDGINRRKIEKEKNIRPGSEEWFRLWFAKPHLTGEKPVGDAPAPKAKNPNYIDTSKKGD